MGKPVIKKLGTIECDLMETTPVVLRGRLYRIEWVHESYRHKAYEGDYFRAVDTRTGWVSPPFAVGHKLCSAYVEGDTVYSYGVRESGAPEVRVFCSQDLNNWSSQTALSMPGWDIYNTSVCEAGDRYVMAFEVGAPTEIVGNRFTNFFAESTDLLSWQPLPRECVYATDRYTACPTIRYLDGHFYVIYLECITREGQDECFMPCIVRSRDLMDWESSPHNPVMEFSDEDRRVANPNLAAEQQERIATAYNRNNSDLDLCEFEGRVVIYYSWGNQLGTDHLAQAVYPGTLASFLRGFFPE